MRNARARPEMPASLRTVADYWGISPSALRKAVMNGRLQTCVAWNRRGQPFITDLARAEEEFWANRDPARSGYDAHTER
jgi:hypothetical protein